MFTYLPVHSEALQKLHEAWLFQHANTSKGSNVDCGGPGTCVQRLPLHDLWFGHGCSADRMLLEHERNYGLGMDALVGAFIQRLTELWFGHGCSGSRMQSKINGIMVWAWMLW